MTVNRLKSASKPWTNSRKETEESDEGTSPPSMKQRKSVLPQNKQSMKGNIKNAVIYITNILYSLKSVQ